ncbi:HD domain-containing protein [Pyrobaculum neutrophilum]|uniref:5'-deoxynucleotidase n=1 Tax=Pyrobaculum neutrophilum (strain DSM 2338 / JCM 9278 / NBRC 100436 / V24Sta) TaxID=444157 RepID=B1YAN8_PYRNV|nr:HD family hydrolase [Pyrobaculum neutrophilum]ACB39117.1 metal dependent phosphohydrolase [Pyrobaculum neutrophilum V24Sta]
MTDLLAVVDTLCKTPRVGWLQRGAWDAESVCAHSLLVTLLAGEIAARLNAEGAEINMAEVLAVAAVHDLAEAVLGHPGREVRDRLRWEELEEEIFKREFPHLAELFRWYRYETNTVGKIVAFADKLATLIRACRYKQLGYPTDDLAKALYKKLMAYDGLAHILDYYVGRYCGGVLP